MALVAYKQHFLLVIVTIIIKKMAGIGNIDYFKYELDSSPKDLVWCGTGNHIAMIMTEQSSVYRSEDNGLHWKKLNDIFSNTGKDELEENENEIGKVASIIQSPADNTLLIFLGTLGINWVVEDCGLKIKALNHGRRISEFYFHPTERDWGLASAYTLCEDFQGEPCKLFKEIYLTRDLGVNWEILASYVNQFGWGIVEKAQINKGVPKERILMTYNPQGKGDQNNRGWSYKIDFIYSDDFFKTKKVLVSKGNKFLLSNHYLFVVQVIDQETQEVMLLASKSTHKEYDFLPIETGIKSYAEHSYTFLDTSLHSVFLHTNHFGEHSQYGHIYTSGIRGLHYALSLKNNIRSLNGQCDFEKVNSVEGLYIANVISGKYMKMAEKEMMNYANNQRGSISQEGSGSGSHNKANVQTNPKLTYQNYIKTMITYNKGGDWERIKAPIRDSKGDKYDCGDYCFLNLHGITSDYAPFYSVDSAAGIIIANGNVGHYLSSTEINTFLSRDGGLSWFEMRKGAHIYEIGDHGGLILLADDRRPSNAIHYTWDEGLTWEELRISEKSFMVKNIIIEPSSSSHHFMIYGDAVKEGNKKGIVIGVDFGNVYPPCVHPQAADTEKSDYETWTPNDGRAGHECLLGKKTTIVRRKRDHKCVNTELFERKTVVELCECSDNDYQCDVGYERSEPGFPCAKEGDMDEVHKPPTSCNGKYFISKGYRRIPGDKCIKGMKYDPIAVPCPYNGFLSFKLIMGIIVFGVIIWLGIDSYINGRCDIRRLIEMLQLNGINQEAIDYSNKNDPYHHINIPSFPSSSAPSPNTHTDINSNDNAIANDDDDNVLFDEDKEINTA